MPSGARRTGEFTKVLRLETRGRKNDRPVMCLTFDLRESRRRVEHPYEASMHRFPYFPLLFLWRDSAFAGPLFTVVVLTSLMSLMSSGCGAPPPARGGEASARPGVAAVVLPDPVGDRCRARAD